MAPLPRNDTSRPLLICGTRTLAEEITDIVSEIPGMRVAGYVENWEPAKAGQTLEGLPITWIDQVGPLAATHQAVCALATTLRSRFTDQVAALGVPFGTI